MLWIIYLFLFIFAGIISWQKILPQRNPIETILIGSLWGMILSCIFPFFLSFIFNFYTGVILSAILCLITIVIVGWWSRKEWTEILYKLKGSIKKEKKSLVILLAAFFVIVIPYMFLVSRTLFINQNGWYSTGFISAYGDVPFHLMYISSFVWGDNFPPQNPDFAGTQSDYPFLPNIISASLISLGADLIKGYMVPIFVLSIIIVALLIYVPWRITKNTGATVLVPIIFLLSGGWGFWWFFQTNGLKIFAFGNKIGNVIINNATNINELGINLMNVMTSSLLPQRGVLFGLPIFLSVILLWFNLTRRSIIASSLLVASLPLLHPHTFITLFIVLPFFLITQIIRKNFSYGWIWFFIIIAFAVLPIFIFLYPNIDNSPIKFIHFTNSWMKKRDNFIWYWFKNLGIFLPLLIFALFSKKISKDIKIWYLPFIPLFFIANFILFSPWDFDNHKLFNSWCLVSSFLVAFIIVIMFQNRNLFVKIFALICLLSVIISGGVDVIRFWHSSHEGYQLFSPQDQEIAEFLKTNMPPHSVFLSSTSHLSPLVLSGRKRFLGYLGWLFAHGINYNERLNDAALIYKGGEQSKLLIKKWGITHILIGSQEQNEFSINLPFFEENYEKIYDKNNYEVFVVK